MVESLSTLWRILQRKRTGTRSTSSSSDVNMVRLCTYLLATSADFEPDDRNMHYKIFIDIKSELLRDVLRQVLQGMPTVSLHGDKPEVWSFQEILSLTTYAILDTDRDSVSLSVPD